MASYAVLVLFVALGANVATHFVLTKSPVVAVGYAKLQQMCVIGFKVVSYLISKF